MSNYQSNSHKSKALQNETPREKRVEKVVKGKVKTKKNEGRKLANIFISEDAANVKSYVFMDVLVPAIKKAVSDIVRDGIDMILYGETDHRDRRRRNSRSDRVSFRDYDRDYDRARDRDRDRRSSRNRFDYDDITFETRGEAELVRDRMLDVADEYGMVTVADMYDMADISVPYTAANYGWMKSALDYIEIKRTRDGEYVLKMRKAMPID